MASERGKERESAGDRTEKTKSKRDRECKGKKPKSIWPRQKRKCEWGKKGWKQMKKKLELFHRMTDEMNEKKARKNGMWHELEIGRQTIYVYIFGAKVLSFRCEQQKHTLHFFIFVLFFFSLRLLSMKSQCWTLANLSFSNFSLFWSSLWFSNGTFLSQKNMDFDSERNLSTKQFAWKMCERKTEKCSNFLELCEWFSFFTCFFFLFLCVSV